MKVRRGRPPRLVLDSSEAALLTNLAQQLTELLGAESSEPGAQGLEDAGDPLAEIVGPMDSGDAPDDPVLRRLLPDAYRDDEDAAAEWRRLGRSEVRATKSQAVDVVLSELRASESPSIPLDDDHVMPWLSALTDLRLALGTRLGITDDRWYDEALRLPEDDPRRLSYAIYDWLTTCQATILDAVA